MSIGENVARLRKEKGLTQQALADLVLVNSSMIAQIERGTKTLSMPLGKAVSEALGCSMDDLLSESKSV